MTQDRIVRYIVVVAWIVLALWLVIWVGGWWRWLGVFLLIGLLSPATWRASQGPSGGPISRD